MDDEVWDKLTDGGGEDEVNTRNQRRDVPYVLAF